MAPRTDVATAACIGCGTEYGECRAVFERYHETECCPRCIHVTTDGMTVVWETGELASGGDD